MRKMLCWICACLCLLLPAQAALAAELPTVASPVRGYDAIAAHAADGGQLRLDFTITPQEYMGANKEARAFWQDLLSGLTATYRLQGGEGTLLEDITLRSKGKALISLSRTQAGDQQYLDSPDLEQPIAAPADAALMTALFGQGLLPDALVAETLFQQPVTWAAFRAALAPVGSAEEGYAQLLEGAEASRAVQALLESLDAGLLGEVLQYAADGADGEFAEPLSLYWTEDAEGRPLTAKLFGVFQSGAQLSLSFRHSYHTKETTHKGDGTLLYGGDTMELAFSNTLSLEGGQAKRRMTARATGVWEGAKRSLKMTQNDTNTFAVEGETLKERLSRNVEITDDYSHPENPVKLAVNFTEKSNLESGKDAPQAQGTWEIQYARDGDTLALLSVPFTLSARLAEAYSVPGDAYALDPADPQQAAELAQIGEALLHKFLSAWVSGMDTQQLEQLLP